MALWVQWSNDIAWKKKTSGTQNWRTTGRISKGTTICSVSHDLKSFTTSIVYKHQKCNLWRCKLCVLTVISFKGLFGSGSWYYRNQYFQRYLDCSIWLRTRRMGLPVKLWSRQVGRPGSSRLREKDGQAMLGCWSVGPYEPHLIHFAIRRASGFSEHQ